MQKFSLIRPEMAELWQFKCQEWVRANLSKLAQTCSKLWKLITQDPEDLEKFGQVWTSPDMILINPGPFAGFRKISRKLVQNRSKFTLNCYNLAIFGRIELDFGMEERLDQADLHAKIQLDSARNG